MRVPNTEHRGPSIRDVARLAEVSPATVSKVLNGKPGVSAEARARVNQAIRELDYQPGRLQRSLAGGSLKILAVVIKRRHPNIMTDPFYHEVMNGLDSVISNAGYHLVYELLESDDMKNGHKEDDEGLGLRALMVDGIFLVGYDIPAGLRLSLRKRGIKVVLIDNIVSDFDCVAIDNFGGAKRVTEHLLANGRKRLAFMGSDPDCTSYIERLAGFKIAHLERGISFEPDLLFFGSGASVDHGFQRATAALKAGRRFDAVVCANDKMAIGVMRAVREAGLSVPEDVAVVGFDDIEWAEHADPPLTTVNVPRYQIGRLAGKRLLEMLVRPDDDQPYRIVVPVNLVVRKSCGVQR